MGNIGIPVKEIEFEPLPDTVPVPEIVPAQEPEFQPAHAYLQRLALADLPSFSIEITGYLW